jgi:hypothetical protein
MLRFLSITKEFDEYEVSKDETDLKEWNQKKNNYCKNIAEKMKGIRNLNHKY